MSRLCLSRGMHGDFDQNATLDSLQFHFIIIEEKRPRLSFPTH
jgi:hypothetical protein